MDFNKLTLKSQEAVAAAQELARRMGNPELYPEHLLVALLDQELPRELVPDPDSLRAEAEAALRAKPSTEGASQQPQVGATFSRVLDKAVEEARRLEVPRRVRGAAEGRADGDQERRGRAGPVHRRAAHDRRRGRH